MPQRIDLNSVGVDILIIVQNHVQLEDGSNFYMGPSSAFLYTNGMYKIDKPEVVLSTNLALIQQAIELIKLVADWLANEFHGTPEELLDEKLCLPEYPHLYFKQNVQSDGKIFSIIYTTLYDELLKSVSKSNQNLEKFANVDPLKSLITSKNFKEMLKDNKPKLTVIKGGKTDESTKPRGNGPTNSGLL
jgi:hypothetical protein